MSLYEFITRWVTRCNDHPEERRGQALFNELYLTRPDLSERMRASDHDPFYSDSLVPVAVAWIGANWVGGEA